MRRQYNSYLVRHWTLDPEHSRVIVEHVQSGVQAQFPSLDAAREWIEAHLTRIGEVQAPAPIPASDRAGFVVIHGAGTNEELKDNRGHSTG